MHPCIPPNVGTSMQREGEGQGQNQEKRQKQQGQDRPSDCYRWACHSAYYSFSVITQQTLVERLPSGLESRDWPAIQSPLIFLSWPAMSLLIILSIHHPFISQSRTGLLSSLFWHRLLHEWILVCLVFFLEVIAKKFSLFLPPCRLLSQGRFQQYHQPSKGSWIKEPSAQAPQFIRAFRHERVNQFLVSRVALQKKANKTIKWITYKPWIQN